MRIRKLERFEDDYLFNFSAVVWYVLIGLSVLAIAGCSLLFLWGVIPTFKHQVKKPDYPAPVTVSLQELQPVTNVPAETVQGAQNQSYDADEAAYSASLATMKKLIPSSRRPWRSTGHWERVWYQKKWVVDRVGTLDYLNAAFKKTGASTFTEKKQLLDGYIHAVSVFPEKDRMSALLALMKYTGTNLAESLSNVRLLSDSARHFSTNRTDYLMKLAKFGEKNPRDGRAFIEYVNKTIGKFSAEARADVLQSLIAGYYQHFNDIAQQVEATNLFFPLLRSIGPEQQAKMLKKYYDIYAKKNAARQTVIKRMNSGYEKDVALAKAHYEVRELRKASYRMTGLLGVLSGIGAIAVLALMLVLLAIQRGVRRIEAYHAQQKR